MLLQGPFKLRAATHKYPFSFTFPSHCDLGGSASKRDLEVLRRNGDQELPPTMPNSGGQVGSEVTYRLTAKVYRALKDWKDEIELKFTPARGISKPDPAFTEIREVRLEHEEKYRVDDSGEPRALTAKDGLKNVFRRHNATTKTIKSFATASGPTNIVIGQPCPITICLKRGATDEKAFPKVVLKNYEVTLTAHTNLQFPTNYWLEEVHEIVLSKQTMDMEMVPDQGFEPQGIFDSTETWVEPTFTGWALSRTYLMNVYLTVEVVGKRFRLMLRWPDVVLHSCRLDRMVETKLQQEQQSSPAYMPGGGVSNANGFLGQDCIT